MNNNELDTLKNKVNLLEYISRNFSECREGYKSDKYVRLNPCPICGKKDHFHVYLNSNSYSSESNCCTGGTIIDFLMESKGVTQGQAIDELKNMTGYSEFKAPKVVTEEKRNFDFLPLIELAKKNVDSTDYFKDRGFSEETIKNNSLGYLNIGLNYAIGKFPELFPNKKPNDYFKNFKYFIPCFDKEGNVPFFINRYADEEGVPTWVKDHIKVMNPKGSSPIPLNLKYLNEEFFKPEYIFICEGWADALSFEEVGYKSIALNSTSNYKILSKYIDKILNTDLIKNKIFIICGDADAAGSKLGTDLQNYFNKNKIPSDVFVLPKTEGIKDINDLLVKDKKQFIFLIANFLDTIENKEYLFDDYTDFNDPSIPVFEGNNCYWKRLKDDGKQSISNFTIQPITIVDNGESTEMQTIIVCNRNFKVQRTFTLNDFLSVQKFKSALNHFALTFIGKDTDLEHIKSIITYKKFNLKSGVNCTGFHEINNTWYFVTGDKCIDEKGNINSDIVISKHLKEIDTNVLDMNPLTKDELLELGPRLFKFNELKITSVIISYCCAIWAKEILWKNDIRFPHLLLIGEAGSGKYNTYDYIISSILNMTTGAIGATGLTKFSVDKMMSSSNTIPFVIEEYKPFSIGPTKVNLISGVLRESYDHTTSTRGNKDRKLERLTYSSPLILIGEVGTDETASKERSLLALFSKKNVEVPEYKNNFKYLLKNNNILNKLGRSIFNEILKLDKTQIYEEIEALEQFIDQNISLNRVKESVNIAFWGLSILEKVFANLGLNMESIIGFNKKELYNAINIATYEDLLDSAQSSKSVIDVTLESFNTLAVTGKLVKGFHYSVINNGAELAIYMATTYPIFNENKINLQTEFISSVNQFNKQLRAMPYYITSKSVKLFTKEYFGYAEPTNKVNRKCIVLDIAMLKERGLDISELIGQEYKDPFNSEEDLIPINDTTTPMPF